MEAVHVNLGPRSYDIQITSAETAAVGELGQFARQASPRSKLALVICDSNVSRHAEAVVGCFQEAGLASELMAVRPGEESKSIATTEMIYNRLAELAADRQTLIVAVGGGVVGDLAGFVAATYNRGLPFLQIPTTLLAMVDSSVGGKVGINLTAGKNLVGAFHQPRAVWINTHYLQTLPQREFRSGLAEVVKYGVILDADFFEWLESNHERILQRDPPALEQIISRSCRLKADVVEKDEREETGLRAVLNYGHTFAHAYEVLAGYGSWLHGEAVAAGMIAASRLAERLGRIPGDLTHRQRQLLVQFGLPVAAQADWPVEELLAVMRRDKKAKQGRLRFVLPTRLGHVELVDDIAEELVTEVLTETVTA